MIMVRAFLMFQQDEWTVDMTLYEDQIFGTILRSFCSLMVVQGMISFSVCLMPSSISRHTQFCHRKKHLQERIYSRSILVVDPFHDGNSRLKPLRQWTISNRLTYEQDVEKSPVRGLSNDASRKCDFRLAHKIKCLKTCP